MTNYCIFKKNGLLSFSRSLKSIVNSSDHAKCISENNQ